MEPYTRIIYFLVHDCLSCMASYYVELTVHINVHHFRILQPMP